jgi:hypothetical protein
MAVEQNILSKSKSQIDKAAQGQQSSQNQIQKSLTDKQNFLKEQNKISASDAKNAIAAAVLPILLKFINAEKSANAIFNKIINDTKKNLKNKGRIEVVNGAITFVPRDKGNYVKFKEDFDRKVNRLKKTITILKTAIDALIVLLKVTKTALTAFSIYLSLQKKKLLVLSVAASADLLTPLPVKSAASTYIIEKQLSDDFLQPLKDKINNYTLVISFITSMIQIFQKQISAIKLKLDTLSFTIGTNSTINNDLKQIISQISSSELNDTEYNNGDKNFTIKIITTPSGALQAVAYDTFSMMKITQTAPSKLRKADELINELKQILG